MRQSINEIPYSVNDECKNRFVSFSLRQLVHRLGVLLFLLLFYGADEILPTITLPTRVYYTYEEILDNISQTVQDSRC